MKYDVTANRLKEAITRANILPVELSEKSGVSQASISQYMNGSHRPSNISSGKMARVLGCDPVWLMGFDVPRDYKPRQEPLPKDKQLMENKLLPMMNIIMDKELELAVRKLCNLSPERRKNIIDTINLFSDEG